MAGGGGGKKDSGGSTGSTGTTPPPFSWSTGGGANPSGGVFNLSTQTFDPKIFGSNLLKDATTAYKQGPKVDPIASFNPFTQQTKGLIDQGLGQVSANAGGPLADFASGKNLGASNPYLNDIIRQTNDDTTSGVNSTFNSSGLFGSDVHAKGLSEGLANADNNLRYTDYQNGFSNMLNAQQAQASNTAQGLGLSGLLDSKNAEKIASDQQQWDASNNAPFNHISKYLDLLNGNQGANAANTNKPLGWGDILGGIFNIL